MQAAPETDGAFFKVPQVIGDERRIKECGRAFVDAA